MPIDPALAPLLEMMNALPHLNAPFDPAALRLADEQPMPVPKAGVAEVRDVTLGTSAGAVNARLYHPMPGTTLPLLVFIHGGGWVFGTLDTHDPLCRALAAAAEIAVLSLEYPRAPEHRYPAALDTVRAAVVTAVEQADTLGIDAGRIAVGGDSAGGNLSAALCLATRDEGGPAIAHQLLLYPVVDNALRAAATRGVKVRLLVSNWNTEKPAIDHLKSLAMLPNVEVRIVTIPKVSTGFIPFARVWHSKTLVIDGKLAWVGTSNWAGGYFDLSRNMEVVMRNEAMARRLYAVQEQAWSSPYAQPLDINKDYPKPNKGKEE